ncbi:MAG TPA: putative Ig domain-containing protein, partial [Leptospiraceae bacterium]|nr:putative Ig domain-containing protein [Leptospiraceae bacterium]HNF16307.1 putative Ig domain-containing protein [Leptospiraceae bacterium]HNI98483.1 putative Ig domain-containing protein [Leptospiraceae bacterium]
MRKIVKSIIWVMLFSFSACVNPSMQDKLRNSSAILLLLKKYPVPEISYSSKSFAFFKGSAVSAVPTVKGKVKNCNIFPSLPAGMNFDKGTCTVSGTPQSLQSEIQYTVTASEVSGKTFGTQIGISVNPIPIKLNYPDSPYSFFKNGPVTAVSPVLTGTAVSYSISPSLPAGMVFDTQTGQISGTPTVYSPAADYTVTVTGEKETQTSVISLKVDFMRPWPVLQPILMAQAGLGVSAAETASTIGTLAGPGTNWYGGVLAPNGIIYGIPRLHTSVLRIDPSSNTVSTFGTFAGGVQKWWGGVLAPNGKIYGIPNSATNILQIDPDTDTAGTFGSAAGGWAGGVLAPNGKIYSIPNNATNVLVIDPKTDTTYTFGSLPGTAAKWVGGVLAPNGKIYGIPNNATNVLVIDPDTDTVSTFGAMPGGGAWRGGVLAPNGKIYGMPS